MAEHIVTLVNEMGGREGMPDGIQFQNIHDVLTLSGLYADEVSHDNNDNDDHDEDHEDDSYASDDDWENEKNPERDVNVVANRYILDDELEAIDDLDDENKFHINDRLADNKGIADNGVQHKHEINTTILVVLIKMKNNRTILVVLIKITNYRII